jgi:hypothetical protein
MAKTIRKRARKSRTPESGVLAEILQCLRNHRILCFRMNTGAHVATDAKGKPRMIRYGVKGMADVLAFVNIRTLPNVPAILRATDFTTQVIWIEAKAKGGKQSPDQSIFQQVVEADGHWYVVVRSYEELEAYLKSKGVIR